MNMVFGILLLACVVIVTLRFKREDPVRNLMVLTFWSILGFFMLIHPGTNMTPRLEDIIGWLWIDLTLLPATLLAGVYLPTLEKRWKIIAYLAMAAGIFYAIGRVVMVPPMDSTVVGEMVWMKF
jgi:FtsH-binding integral membrane protein